MKKKGFGFVKKTSKKQDPKVKFIWKEERTWDNREIDYYAPSFPIQDDKTKKYFLTLKQGLLSILDRAKETGEIQEFKFDNAVYRIWPDGDEKILKQFKHAQW